MKAVATVASPTDEALRSGFFPDTAPPQAVAAAWQEPPKRDSQDLDPSLFHFILKHSKK